MNSKSHAICVIPQKDIFDYSGKLTLEPRNHPFLKSGKSSEPSTCIFEKTSWPSPKNQNPASKLGRWPAKACPGSMTRKEDLGVTRIFFVYPPSSASATPPKFNSSPLKNDGWKTILSFWEGLFWGAMLNFKEVNYFLSRFTASFWQHFTTIIFFCYETRMAQNPSNIETLNLRIKRTKAFGTSKNVANQQDSLKVPHKLFPTKYSKSLLATLRTKPQPLFFRSTSLEFVDHPA